MASGAMIVGRGRIRHGYVIPGVRRGGDAR
jgi:hypothetical protein